MVVDPAVDEPVRDWLKSKELNLIAILQTHHHEDHIGGTKGLLQYWPKAEVIASKDDLERIPLQTSSIRNGDTFQLMDSQIKVLGVPGHTRHHIAFYLPANKEVKKEPALFCGDTLFGAGCGRLFEGTAEEMFIALHKINSLPADTKIYCAHEYTEANLRWATSVSPEDLLIKKRLEDIIIKRRSGLLSLPSTISEERITNLFIRAKDVKEFASLRRSKDNWRG